MIAARVGRVSWSRKASRSRAVSRTSRDGGSAGAAAALLAVTLLSAGGLGGSELGGEPVELGAGHSGQAWVGEPTKHPLAALGRPGLLTDRHRGSSHGIGTQGVVPGAVHGVPLQWQGGEALLADRDAGGVVAAVQVRLDAQPGARAGGLDGLDHDLVAGQRAAPPVEGDVGEQSVLDLVPFRGARREVADRDRQPCFGGQGGQLALPYPVAVAVGAAGIGGDQQPGGARVVESAARGPPPADGLDGEHRGVVVDPDVDPAGVAGDVVDAVGDRLLDIRAAEEEVVVLHLNRLALGVPFPPRHRQVPQLLPLLRVHADHRLAVLLVVGDLLVDVVELAIPIRVLGAFPRLGVALQAEARRLQQSTHRRGRHRVPLPGQLPRPGAVTTWSSTATAIPGRPFRPARSSPTGPPARRDRSPRPAYDRRPTCGPDRPGTGRRRLPAPPPRGGRSSRSSRQPGRRHALRRDRAGGPRRLRPSVVAAR